AGGATSSTIGAASSSLPTPSTGGNSSPNSTRPHVSWSATPNPGLESPAPRIAEVMAASSTSPPPDACLRTSSKASNPTAWGALHGPTSRLRAGIGAGPRRDARSDRHGTGRPSPHRRAEWHQAWPGAGGTDRLGRRLAVLVHPELGNTRGVP